MTRPKAFDLYCCEGGVSEGLRRAGFDPYGLDLFEDYSQKRYPFPSVKMDALAALDVLNMGDRLPFAHKGGTVEWLGLADFTIASASPPCQRYSITNAARQHDYPDLIGPTREALQATGLPYVIENVEGAPLVDPLLLCGRMFGLSAIDTDGIELVLDRHRLFESIAPLTAPEHPEHGDEWVGGCYGGARRDKYEAKYVRKGGYVPPNKAVVEAYMGIDWMTWKGLHQSIPPAYTEHLGKQLLEALS